MEDKYSDILKKKYNAVCITDNLLYSLVPDTQKDSVSSRLGEIIVFCNILERIERLSRMGISVIINTNFIGDELAEFEKRLTNLQKCFLNIKNVYLLVNNQTELGYIENDNHHFSYMRDENPNIIRDTSPFPTSFPLRDIKKWCANSEYKKYFNLSIFRNRSKEIIGVKLSFLLNDEKMIDEIYNDMKKNIVDLGFTDFEMNKGVRRDKAFIQIRPKNTVNALKHFTYLTEIPESSILRIGSYGKNDEVDYNLLNCPQGFSTNSVSGKDGVCQNILDTEGRIISGSDAVCTLLDKVKFVPLVCIENTNQERYKKSFKKVEKELDYTKAACRDEANEFIKRSLGTSKGLYDIYDEYCGGVIVPMYDFDTSDFSNSLMQFWADGLSKKYVLLDDKNYILRGSQTYYYFLANCDRGKTSFENVCEWYDNYIDFFDGAIQALELRSCIKEKKLVLGILDNCRNVLLILLNRDISFRYDKNVLLQMSEEDYVFSTLIDVEKKMYELSFTGNFSTFGDICKIIESTKAIMESYRSIEEHLYNSFLCNSQIDYSKYYRPYRELDNFGELCASLKYDAEKVGVGVCGMCYGGMELPIVDKAISNYGEHMKVYLFKQDIYYMDKKRMNLNSLDFNKSNELIYFAKNKYESVKLYDDNILTGKSLQLAINTLAEHGINVSGAHIVRRPTTNRLDQMFFGNTTAVNYRLFGNFIGGLTYTTNYTRKDTDWVNEDGTIDGYDSFGITDMGLKKIYECLIKNHSYAESSAVGNYQKRLYKLPIK